MQAMHPLKKTPVKFLAVNGATRDSLLYVSETQLLGDLPPARILPPHT